MGQPAPLPPRERNPITHARHRKEVFWQIALPVAIGVVIGHEISHGFDDQGAQYDAQGRLANWWTPADLAKFQQRGLCVVDQFEELFTLNPIDVQERFATLLSRLVLEADVHVLLHQIPGGMVSNMISQLKSNSVLSIHGKRTAVSSLLTLRLPIARPLFSCIGKTKRLQVARFHSGRSRTWGKWRSSL
jgi:hypothetical protein